MNHFIYDEMSKSIMNSQIESVINFGDYNRTEFENLAKIEETPRQEVSDVLKTLFEEDNEKKIYEMLKQLTNLCWQERILHFPKAVDMFVCLLDKTEIIDNEKNLSQFFECLNVILFFEQLHKSKNWNKISELLITAMIKKADFLLLRCPNNIIIDYLGRTNREDAVEIIFSMMKQHPSESYHKEYSTIQMALGKNRLYKEYSDSINLHLEKFRKSKNELLVKLAEELWKNVA